MTLRWPPIARWLPAYRAVDLRGDVVAGATTAAMLVPQSMAYALLAGLPPIVGLYAAIAPPAIYAVFGGSRKLAVGPVAMDSLLVAAVLSPLFAAQSEGYVAAAALLALLVGAIQAGMGVLRLGFLVNFLSRPVISGFTSAAALVIGASQLGALVGVALPPSQGLHTVLGALARAIDRVHLPTLALGLASLVVLVALARRPRLPRALIVLALGGLAAWAFDLPAVGVAVLGAVPSGMPSPTWPEVPLETTWALLPGAAAIALLSFAEAISSGLAVCEPGEELDPNRELVALGLANAGGGLLRGYPVAGGLSRTAVNAQAGARTPLAGLVAAGLVAATLVVLTPLFAGLPKTVLSAIIVMAVVGLVDTALPRELWRVRRRELAVLVVTFAATLFLGITTGLALGVAASLALFVLRTTRPHTAVLGRLPGTEVYRNVRRFPDAETVPGLLLVRLDAQLYFANAAFLKETIRARLAEGPARAVILDAGGIHDVDVSALAALRQIRGELAARGVALYLADVKGPVRDVLARSGFMGELGAERLTFTVHEAVERATGARTGPVDPRARQFDAE